MRSYELTLVLRSSLKDSEKAKLLDTIEGFIKGARMKKEEWGQKPLSYPIKHELSGFYVNYMMELEQPVPSDFEKSLYTTDGVLRHLLMVHKTKGKKAQETVAQKPVRKAEPSVKEVKAKPAKKVIRKVKAKK